MSGQGIRRPPFCRPLENAGKKMLRDITGQIAAVGHLVLKWVEISYNGIQVVVI
jgi:hypothetical protein